MSLINELCVHLQNADPINLSPDIAVKMVAAIAVNDYKLQQQSNNYMIGGDSHIICDLAALLGVEERREAVFFEVKRLARLADSLSEKDYEDTNRYLKLGYLLKAQLGVEFGPCDEDFDELVLLEIARLKNHVQFTEVPMPYEEKDEKRIC